MPTAPLVRLPYMSTLADRIQEALDDTGAIAADLARACGVKPPSVSAWLSGDTKSLKSSTAIRAAEFLKVNQLWLTEGRGPKRTEGGPAGAAAEPALPERPPVVSDEVWSSLSPAVRALVETAVGSARTGDLTDAQASALTQIIVSSKTGPRSP